MQTLKAHLLTLAFFLAAQSTVALGGGDEHTLGGACLKKLTPGEGFGPTFTIEKGNLKVELPKCSEPHDVHSAQTEHFRLEGMTDCDDSEKSKAFIKSIQDSINGCHKSHLHQ